MHVHFVHLLNNSSVVTYEGGSLFIVQYKNTITTNQTNLFCVTALFSPKHISVRVSTPIALEAINNEPPSYVLELYGDSTLPMHQKHQSNFAGLTTYNVGVFFIIYYGTDYHKYYRTAREWEVQHYQQKCASLFKLEALRQWPTEKYFQ